jgi:predicted transposase/invertase (TIGR01784 family)
MHTLQESLKAARDWNAVYSYGVEAAEQKGREEGEHTKAIEIARNMLNKGLDESLVAQLTGLTLAQVVALKG